MDVDNEPPEQNPSLSVAPSDGIFDPTIVDGPLATIVVVGNTSTKSSFIEVLQRTKFPFSLTVRGVESLAEPVDRPKIDYIVFILDLTNLASMNLVKTFLDHYIINYDYFVGRVAVIIQNIAKTHSLVQGWTDMVKLLETFEMFMIHSDLGNRAQIRVAATKVGRQIEFALHMRNGLNPILTRTVEYGLLTETRPVKKPYFSRENY